MYSRAERISSPMMALRDSRIWERRRWVVDVQAVGNGENALRYLGRYVCPRPLILHATWLAGQMPPRPPAFPVRGPP